MKVFWALFLGLLLLAGSGFAAALLIPACGVGAGFRPAWLNFCVADDVRDARLATLSIEDSNFDLVREIAQLEREVAAIQCTAQNADPEPPSPIETPPVASTPPSIDADAWRRRDLAVLQGCWELDSEYRVQHVRTGALTHFTEWSMCFTTDGQGREEMLATNGVTCNGEVTGQFDGAGRLLISEPGNLACSDNSFIYQRSLSCALDDTGRASCSVTQPEIGRNSQVQLRRSSGVQ